jgi:hypothetical protein
MNSIVTTASAASTLEKFTGDESIELVGTPAASSRARLIGTLLTVSVLFKLLLAFGITSCVLVDDAYIHLRYARNLIEHGAFVYNLGEPVLGLTSPLYGLLSAGLYGLAGGSVEVAVIVMNIALWTIAAAMLSRYLPSSARIPILTLFLFWPSFIDNQMLGMETPLFVLLLLGSMTATLRGRVGVAAAAFGLALITRPEAVLLAPCLVGALVATVGLRAGLSRLLRPRVLTALLAPGLIYCALALAWYGSIIPQSMLAKTGWNSTHYDSLFTWQSSLLSVPRLTFFPFVDYFPGAIIASLTAIAIGLVLVVGYANLRRGTTASRAWFAFYLIYLAFYIVGKGATEASWYSVPSSAALLLASTPLWPRVEPRREWGLAATGALLLLFAGLHMTRERTPLLHSYVEGYGESAAWLNETAPPDSSVLIGEIGVFGFTSRHHVVDVGALVSPQVQPMKNAGFSLCRMIRESEADYFVVSSIALESNFYPSVGEVWADEADRHWFDERCELLAEHRDKKTFRVER